MKIENIKIDKYLEVHKISSLKSVFLIFDYLSEIIWRTHKKSYIIHIEISTSDNITIPITLCVEPIPESESGNNRPMYQFIYHNTNTYTFGKLINTDYDKYFVYNSIINPNNYNINEYSSPYRIFNVLNVRNEFVKNRFLSKSFTYGTPNIGITYSFKKLLKDNYNFKCNEDEIINVSVAIIYESKEIAFENSDYYKRKRKRKEV